MAEGSGWLARVESTWPDLTAREKGIAQVILDDPRSIALAPALTLSERSGASEATVSRFARKLGYASFMEFRVALSEDLRPATRAILDEVDETDGSGDILRKVVAANVRAVEDALTEVDGESIEAVVDALDQATRVGFFGYGVSHLLAKEALHYFLRFRKDCAAPDDPYEQLMWASNAAPGDVAVVFIRHGVAEMLLRLAETARERGATVISVSSFSDPRLSAVSDIAIAVSNRVSPYREEELSSRMTISTLIDMIYVLIAVRRPLENERRRRAIREVIDGVKSR